MKYCIMLNNGQAYEDNDTYPVLLLNSKEEAEKLTIEFDIWQNDVINLKNKQKLSRDYDRYSPGCLINLEKIRLKYGEKHPCPIGSKFTGPIIKSYERYLVSIIEVDEVHNIRR